MITMIAMKDGLKPSRFLFSLEKRFHVDYIEMLSRADKYANNEEAMALEKRTYHPPNLTEGTRGKGMSQLNEIDVSNLENHSSLGLKNTLCLLCPRHRS